MCTTSRRSINEEEPVTFLRVFKPAEAQQKNIVVTGWEIFDEHPDLILFGGYLAGVNEAHLERGK